MGHWAWERGRGAGCRVQRGMKNVLNLLIIFLSPYLPAPRYPVTERWSLSLAEMSRKACGIATLNAQRLGAVKPAA